MSEGRGEEGDESRRRGGREGFGRDVTYKLIELKSQK